MRCKSEQENSVGKSKEELYQIKLKHIIADSFSIVLCFSHSRCLSISLFLSFSLSLILLFLSLSHIQTLYFSLYIFLSLSLSLSFFPSSFISLVHTFLNLSHLPLLRCRSPISISVSTTRMLCSPSASIYLKIILFLYSNELYCISRNCISRNCIILITGYNSLIWYHISYHILR